MVDTRHRIPDARTVAVLAVAGGRNVRRGFCLSIPGRVRPRMTTRATRRNGHVTVELRRCPGQTGVGPDVTGATVVLAGQIGRDMITDQSGNLDAILYRASVAGCARRQRRDIRVLHRRLRRERHPNGVTILAVRIGLDVARTPAQGGARIAVNVTAGRTASVHDAVVAEPCGWDPGRHAVTCAAIASAGPGMFGPIGQQHCGKRSTGDGHAIEGQASTCRIGVAQGTRRCGGNLSVIDTTGNGCARPREGRGRIRVAGVAGAAAADMRRSLARDRNPVMRRTVMTTRTGPRNLGVVHLRHRIPRRRPVTRIASRAARNMRTALAVDGDPILHCPCMTADTRLQSR